MITDQTVYHQEWNAAVYSRSEVDDFVSAIKKERYYDIKVDLVLVFP
jgi:hypothetical protein